MRTPRYQLRVPRFGSAWSETRAGQFLGRATPAPTLAAAEILSIKARLVSDARQAPARSLRAVWIAVLAHGLAAALGFLVGSLL
jgi:hypothetical protein